MYFITERTSETGKKFQKIEDKSKRIHEQEVALSKEIGFKQWRGGYWNVYGGFSSLIFDEKPDEKIYKRVNVNEWMPKKNCKEGKEIQAKLNSSEIIDNHELNMCVGFNGAPFKTIGFAANNDQFFGFVIDSKWEHEAPNDCEEVTCSKYKELFGCDGIN
jgi:hypothetical protein